MTDWEKIQKAVEAVTIGMAERIDVDKNTAVYRAGTVIRIDLKKL